jgi:hypothetical protein
MRVRCSFCGAEYDAAVTRAGLGFVARCERCGRTGLRPADDDATTEAPARASGSAGGAPERPRPDG